MSDLIPPPKRTSELVVAHMHQLIRSGEWRVGERIPAEPELVGRFGVGRNTIREAVRALEHVGMLAPRRGDGTYVRSANPYAAVIQRSVATELLELLQVRRALESEAAAGAARTASAVAKRRIRQLLEKTEEALGAEDPAQYDAADIDFHAGVVTASGNGLLVEIYAGVVEAMRRSHAEVTSAFRAATAHPVGHRDLVEAIERGDADAARAAVHAYLADAEKEMRR